MLKKLAPLGLVLATVNVHADVAGVHAGASYWSPSFSGGFDSGNSTIGEISLEKDLGYSDTSASGLYVAIEHPIPMLPNLRIERTNLSDSSSSTLNRNIEFEGESFASGSKVKSKFDLTHTDYTGYYEILDGLGWVSADVGVTFRMFDGQIKIADETGATDASLNLDVPVPLFYGKGQFDIPGAPFPVAVGGVINYLSIGGASIADNRFYVSAAADLPVEIGAELGYRRFTMEFDDVGDLTSDLSASGWYASATIHF